MKLVDLVLEWDDVILYEAYPWHSKKAHLPLPQQAQPVNQQASQQQPSRVMGGCTNEKVTSSYPVALINDANFPLYCSY